MPFIEQFKNQFHIYNLMLSSEQLGKVDRICIISPILQKRKAETKWGGDLAESSPLTWVGGSRNPALTVDLVPTSASGHLRCSFLSDVLHCSFQYVHWALILHS